GVSTRPMSESAAPTMATRFVPRIGLPQFPFDALARREHLLALCDRILARAHRDVRVAEAHRFALRHLARRPDRADGSLDRALRLRRDDRRYFVSARPELVAGP